MFNIYSLATIFIPIIVGFRLSYTNWCLAFKIILDITYWLDISFFKFLFITFIVVFFNSYVVFLLVVEFCNCIS